MDLYPASQPVFYNGFWYLKQNGKYNLLGLPKREITRTRHEYFRENIGEHLKTMNDILYKTYDLNKDCGCYQYESTKKYPAIEPGKCSNNPGCKKRIHLEITESQASEFIPLENTIETDRKEFRTPCGQTYWVDEDNYLYTNKTVEHPIAYWIPEYQCVSPIGDDDSDDDDETPPPSPPPMYVENA